MLSLTNVFSVSSALGDSDLDVNLRAVLGFRAWHMCVEHEAAIGTDAVILVVQGGDSAELLAGLKRDFTTVRNVKPAASRADSSELYVLATGYRRKREQEPAPGDA